MEKGTELELKSLINSVKELKEAYYSPDDEDSKKIKEYIIEAIEDYNDTKKKILKMINENPDIITGTCYGIKPNGCDDTGYNFNQMYVCAEYKEFHHHLEIIYSNVSGHYNSWVGKREFYDTSKKIATDIRFDNGLFSSMYHEAPHEDLNGSLVNDHTDNSNRHFFTYGKYKKSYAFNRENITKFKFQKETLVRWKERADITRKVTKLLVEYFKDVINYRLNTYKNHLNNFSNCAASKYQKVDFD